MKETSKIRNCKPVSILNGMSKIYGRCIHFLLMLKQYWLLILLLYKSCTVFIRSSPSFFELTYMMLQNNCINNGANNGSANFDNIISEFDWFFHIAYKQYE